jgi:hypothetical protein
MVSPLDAAATAAPIVLKLGFEHEPPLTIVGRPVVDTYHVPAAWAVRPPNIISPIVNAKANPTASFFKFMDSPLFD